MLTATCNATLSDLRIGDSEEIVTGSLTFHTLSTIINLSCAVLALLLSLYLIWMHALHYTRPHEQRHIIRILFMVPVYSISNFLSNYQYWKSVYYQLASATYAAIAVTAFFSLLCNYVAPGLSEYKKFFRTIKPKPWGNFFPITIGWYRACCGGSRGIWRTPRSGLTWFNILWFGVFQYGFFRIAMSIVAAITQMFGRYCQGSTNPLLAHIYILAIDVCSATAAMYCLDQFSWQLKDHLKEHKPTFKLVCIKLVFAFSLYQTLIISIFTSSEIHVLEPTPIISYPDLTIGLPALILSIELLIISFLHVLAFPWQPYRIPSADSDPTDPTSPRLRKQGGFLGLLALVDAMNIWDLVKALGRAFRWLFIGVRHREADASYNLVSTRTADGNGSFGATPSKKQVEGAYLELRECDRDSALATNDIHPGATDTLL